MATQRPTRTYPPGRWRRVVFDSVAPVVFGLLAAYGCAMLLQKAWLSLSLSLPFARQADLDEVNHRVDLLWQLRFPTLPRPRPDYYTDDPPDAGLNHFTY